MIVALMLIGISTADARPPVDDCIEDPGACPGGGSGGGGGGGGGTTAPSYRLSTDAYVIESGPLNGSITTMRIKAYSRFERLIGTTWTQLDANTLGVDCWAPGVHDQDFENNAGFTDVKFWIGPGQLGTSHLVHCVHTATYQGVAYNATTLKYFLFF